MRFAQKRKCLIILFCVTCFGGIMWYFTGMLELKRVMHPKSDRSVSQIVYHPFPADKRLFQSLEEVEFPTIHGNQYRIPHIIHQIYTDENIPQTVAPWVQSLIEHNPKWTYMFWTYESGRTLIKNTHPYLLDAYNSFTSSNGVKKSDMLRYVVLYEFGGLYADVDVSCLRPLDTATTKYACIMPTEPFEHSVLHSVPYLINIGIMLCRPKHPFIKFVLRNLTSTSDKGNPVGVTGPKFVTRMFNAYYNITENDKIHSLKTDMSSNSPVFYKGTFSETDNDAVYVPNSQYFMDTVSPLGIKILKDICVEANTELKKRACFEYESRNATRQHQRFTFTVHHWLNLWTYSAKSIKELPSVPISDVVPNRVLYP